MPMDQEMQDWQKSTDFDTDTVVILGMIGCGLLTCGIFIGMFIMAKCSKLKEVQENQDEESSAKMEIPIQKGDV